MGRKTPEPVKQPKPKKTPDDKRLISFRIAHAVADPDARPPPRSPQAASPKTRRSPSASPARLPISASSESKAARRGAVPPSPPPLPPVRFAASHGAFGVCPSRRRDLLSKRIEENPRRWRGCGRIQSFVASMALERDREKLRVDGVGQTRRQDAKDT